MPSVYMADLIQSFKQPSEAGRIHILQIRSEAREVKPPADPWPHQNLTQATWLWSPHLQPKPLLRFRPGGQGSWQFLDL